VALGANEDLYRSRAHVALFLLTFAKIGATTILGLSVVNVTEVAWITVPDVGVDGRFDLSDRVAGRSCAKRIVVGLASVARMAAM
jgi:hypothetical protein